MPPIRSSASAYYALLTTSISLDSEIMSPYSYYAKKELTYIIIMALSSHQPSSCLECTKVNMYSFYNIYSVSINKCIFLVFVILFYPPYSLDINI